MNARAKFVIGSKIAWRKAKGDSPFVTFRDEAGEPIGELWLIDGVFSFAGDCDASAKVFFDFVEQYSRDQLTKR